MSAVPLRGDASPSRSSRRVEGPLLLPSPAAWWRSLRAFSFTASLAPVLLALAIAGWWARSEDSELVVWTLPFYALAALLFHAGTNVLNDFYDYLHGVDPDGDPDPTHAITQGVVSPRFMRFSGRIYFVLGIIIGSVIGLERGALFVLTGIAGALGAYFYTGARFSFKYVALGDVLVFFLMGPALLAIGVWALTGTVPAEVWALSLPVAFLVTAILHGNNLRDRESDRAAGVRTVANLVSEPLARAGFAGLIAAAYVSLVVLVIAGVAPGWSAIALLTAAFGAPLAIRVLRGDPDLVALPVSCAKLHLLFSLPYIAAIVLAALLV